MTPKDLVVWYYEKRDSFSAPGFNPVDSVGRWYYKTCRAKVAGGKTCGFKHRNLKQSGTWVCGRCGKNWKYEDRFMFKGEVSTSPRIGTFEEKHSRWIDVGVVIHSLLRDPKFKWDMMIFVATCVGFSIRKGLAARFRKDYPDAPGPWGQRSMFERSSRAREELVRRLGRAGIKTT